jgi:hypothetical protein
MNRIQELSRQIARGAVRVLPEEPLQRSPRRPRPANRQASAKPSRNSATFAPSDSSA